MSAPPKTALLAQWGAAGYVGVVSMGLSFVLGRLLGPQGFGDYSALLTLGALFAIVQDGGFKTLLYREGARPSPDIAASLPELQGRATRHVVLVTVLGAALCLPTPAPYGWHAAVALVCLSLQTTCVFVSASLRAKGDFHADAVWQSAYRTASAVGIVGVLLLGASGAPWLVFAGWGLGLAPMLVMMRRHLGPRHLGRQRTGRRMRRSLFTACVAFMAVDAATAIYYRCDILLLRHLGSGAAETGQYAAAYRFLDGIILLAAPVGVVCFRTLRQCMDAPRAFLRLLAGVSLALAGAGGILLALGVPLAAPLVRLTFGPGYDEAARLLPLLLAALLFILPSGLLTQAAIALNIERFYAACAAGAAIMNIALNILLIPDLGAHGAAYATIATEAALMTALLGGLARRLRRIAATHHASSHKDASCPDHNASS
ncbi:oligosaccharide flippase family protein [Desulfobaculum sp. SPO524]|uniref:oligosaccharide flippase family protein n=1 Tax=Desulfobaculum sp. SPO524 TaxID=3378071 RepID=UPI003853F0F0